MTGSTPNPDPRVSVDWAGDQVTMHVNTGDLSVDIAMSDDLAARLRLDLKWAIAEVRRFREVGNPGFFNWPCRNYCAGTPLPEPGSIHHSYEDGETE